MAQNGLLDSFKTILFIPLLMIFLDQNYLQAGSNHCWDKTDPHRGRPIHLFLPGGRPEIMDEYTKVYKVYNLCQLSKLTEILDMLLMSAINTEGQSSRKTTHPEHLRGVKAHQMAVNSR